MSHRTVSLVLATALALVSVACQPTGPNPVTPAGNVPSASPSPVQVSLVQGSVLAPTRVVAAGDGDAVKDQSGRWISTNTGNVISTGGGNWISNNSGNVISTGGGNVISTGGGNVISTGGGNVISTGGGNVIEQGNGNVISTGGGNVISTGGGNVISTGGGNFIPGAIGKVISTGGGNVISTGGGNWISTNSGNVISTGGGNVISTGGGNVISTGGGNYRTAQASTTTDSEPVVGAEVFLADLQGKPIPGFTSSITDDTGHYEIPDVPRGMTFIVVVRVIVKRKVNNESAEEASLVTIGASTQENNRVDVSLATTYTTAALYQRAAEAALGPDPKPFQVSVQLMTAVADLVRKVEDAVTTEVEEVKDTLLGEKELETKLETTLQKNEEIQKALERLIAIAKEPEKPVKDEPKPSAAPTGKPTDTPSPGYEGNGVDDTEFGDATGAVTIEDGEWEYSGAETIVKRSPAPGILPPP